MTVRVIVADWILPGDADPFSDGAVVAFGDGTIEHIGRAEDVLRDERFRGLETERVHGLVMPGLVNAHTHIELSALRGRVPAGGGFVTWVQRLIAVRRELQPEEES